MRGESNFLIELSHTILYFPFSGRLVGHQYYLTIASVGVLQICLNKSKANIVDLETKPVIVVLFDLI